MIMMKKHWFKSGSPWIWLTAGSVSLCLVMVLGLISLIGWQGLSYFWPSPIYQFTVEAKGQTSQLIGEIYERQQIPTTQLIQAGKRTDLTQSEETRYVVKVGNRELNGFDFVSILQNDIQQQTIARNIVVIDRKSNGKLYGYPQYIMMNQQRHPLSELSGLLEESEHWQTQFIQEERDRLVSQQSKITSSLSSEESTQTWKENLAHDALMVRVPNHGVVAVPLLNIVDVVYPNNLSWSNKLHEWIQSFIQFVTENPRESNTAGGVFPAIFGTIFMVIIMSIIVTPFGILAAVYLHEYAENNWLTRMVRIAVMNLAGVPSIVYGVFGLGFFVYSVGGNIDALFFPDRLPTPTFGTPGVLWSAFTLAMLTLPVVIVSTEEGLSRVPLSVRHGSMALGATQAETLWRIILPMATPAIMTGLILAVARAAGEVAPLMLVGVVKMAPSLPIDNIFPFVHLDRKFMHLGYHIYDVGFQSPNVEAARPLVYATSFLLITVVIGLNLTAISIRNHLRHKFQSLEY